VWYCAYISKAIDDHVIVEHDLAVLIDDHVIAGHDLVVLFLCGCQLLGKLISHKALLTTSG
jgi:hypothetical protein